MKNNKLTRICAGVIASVMVLSSTAFAVSAVSTENAAETATTAAAAETTDIQAANNDFCGRGPGGRRGASDAEMAARMAEDLKAAVAVNVITQAESDGITAFLTADKAKPKAGLFADLVTNGILTQEKADTLQANFEAQRELKHQEELNTALDKFVADNTITQEQADKITAAINAAEAARKAARDAVAAMSKADRKTYMDNLRDTQGKPLAALVADGTITQAQADTIGKELRQGRGPDDGRGPEDGRGPMNRDGRGCKGDKAD